jgi:hypothetical protein
MVGFTFVNWVPTPPTGWWNEMPVPTFFVTFHDSGERVFCDVKPLAVTHRPVSCAVPPLEAKRLANIGKIKFDVHLVRADRTTETIHDVTACYTPSLALPIKKHDLVICTQLQNEAPYVVEVRLSALLLELSDFFLH